MIRSLVFCTLLYLSYCSIIGVDLGDASLVAHYLKRGGRPDIVLSDMGRRRFHAHVAFHNGERFIGDTAISVSSRCPSCVSPSLLSLLNAHRLGETAGSIWNSPIGEISPDTILAMLLQHIADSASVQSGETATDVVISVPFAADSSLSALLQRSISLTSLNCLGVLSSPAAAALELRVRQPITDPMNYVFLDIGAKRIASSLVSFTPAKTFQKSAKTSSGLGSISVNNFHQEFIGGDAVTDCLIDLFFQNFGIDSVFTIRDQVGTDRENFDKGMVKIRQIIQKSKEVLAGHPEAKISVDQDLVFLMLPRFYQTSIKTRHPSSSDLVTTITVDHLNSRCPSLMALTQKTLQRTLSGFNLSEVDGIVPIGGGIRSPQLLDSIQNSFDIPLMRMSNADEGVAVGCVYYAASLHPRFAMVKFSLADFWSDDVYSFPQTLSNLDNVIHPRGPRVGKFFSSHRVDGNFSVVYYSGNEYFALVNVRGAHELVENEILKYSSLNTTLSIQKEQKPLKIRINLAISPVNCFEVSSVFATTYVNVTKQMEKLVSSEMTGGNNTTVNATEGQNQTERRSEIEITTSRVPIKVKIPFTVDSICSIVKDQISATQLYDNINQGINHFLQIDHANHSYRMGDLNEKARLLLDSFKLIPDLTVNETLNHQREFLEELKRKDILLDEAHQIRNSFESYLYELKANLLDEESLFYKSCPPEKIQLFKEILETEGDWLDFDSPLPNSGPEIVVEVFTTRMGKLRAIFDEVSERATEHSKRKYLVNSLTTLLEKTSLEFNQLNESLIAKKDKKEVLSKVKDISKWLEKKLDKQAKKSLYDSVAVTGTEIEAKQKDLEKTIRRILAKPKPKPKVEVPSNKTNTSEPSVDEL
ncbi:hypothetical protein P9112_004782 [Eukaryota sp. TZLM1-RC]